MLKVCKFGGTSMANAENFGKVKSIITAENERKFVVVSAPGKRDKSDIKITDLLYKCYDDVISIGSCHDTFKLIRDRFTEIVKDLGLNFDIESVLDETEKGIDAEKTTPDFAASRGEYLSARVMAEYLGYTFVDAADLIRFDSNGNLNAVYTDDKIKTKLSGIENVVIPGFYGKDSFGKIKTFSRGGSDVTGSIIAKGVCADLYENWTDVSGFLVCDPRIVPEAQIIDTLSYSELRELSYMGASVLHAEAIFPLITSKIPINIRNTFRPQDKGTMIVPTEHGYNPDKVITGIAGKKNFSVISIEKSLMNNEVGFIRKVLSVVEHYGLCVEHVPSGIDTLSVILSSEDLKNGVLDDVVREIRESVAPDYIHVIENVALIATVGHGMARRSGTASKIFTALAEANVNIKMIDQGSSEQNIIIGVAGNDYEKCIRTIYNAFFGA